MTDPAVAVDIACATGEGPLWHPETAVLYWTDIPAGQIHGYDPATGEHDLVYEAPDGRIGGFTIQTDGALLLFGEAGAVGRLDPTTGERTPVVAPDPDRFHGRFNDVIADPTGRVYAGVMPDLAAGEPGHLYRLDTDGQFEHVVACDLPNGMGFTPDRTAMYFTDTCEHDPDAPGYVYRYEYDRATGELSGRELFLEATDIDGYPDGLTVDAEGSVWVAFWDGHTLRRFSPDGSQQRVVELSPAKVSSISFGEADYTAAYITTACLATRATEGRLAGSLFRADLGVGGRAEHRSAIAPGGSL
jgi:D-xylonolactonase